MIVAAVSAAGTARQGRRIADMAEEWTLDEMREALLGLQEIRAANKRRQCGEATPEDTELREAIRAAKKDRTPENVERALDLLKASGRRPVASIAAD